MAGPVVEDAAVAITAGRVTWTGPDRELPADAPDRELDAAGRCVLPGFVDPHTHAVWAGSRRAEFVARLSGQPYAAGGIRTTVTATREASYDELVALATARIEA